MDDHNRSILHAKNRLYTTSTVRFQPESSFRIFHRHQAGVQIPTDGSAQTTCVFFPHDSDRLCSKKTYENSMKSPWSMDWFKGKSTGNHGCSHQKWCFPVIFSLHQSIDHGFPHEFPQLLEVRSPVPVMHWKRLLRRSSRCHGF